MKGHQLQLRKMLLIIATLFAVCFAQRPNNVSLCDYYAESLYGTNTNVTQARLMQSIVTLAFGGPFTLENVDPDLTGIVCKPSISGVPLKLFVASITSARCLQCAMMLC
jgi:hypothetical protein